VWGTRDLEMKPEARANAISQNYLISPAESGNFGKNAGEARDEIEQRLSVVCLKSQEFRRRRAELRGRSIKLATENPKINNL